MSQIRLGYHFAGPFGVVVIAGFGIGLDGEKLVTVLAPHCELPYRRCEVHAN